MGRGIRGPTHEMHELGFPMAEASEYRVVATSAVTRGMMRVPGPWRHAARIGDDETLCGAFVDGMYRFANLAFGEVHPRLRCSDCSLVFGILDDS